MEEEFQLSIEDEEQNVFDTYKSPTPEPTYLCSCLLGSQSSEPIVIPQRKQRVLTVVSRTEQYLTERRIPELIRFLLTKVLSQNSSKPIVYLEKLLDDCMLFRSRHGLPPVLYEEGHLKAVVKSFDPGDRGWLSAGQIRRLYLTLGLNVPENLDDQYPVDDVLQDIKSAQESELYDLVSAGTNIGQPESSIFSKNSSTSTPQDKKVTKIF